MSKNLKHILTFSSAILMMASVGVSSNNLASANSNKRANTTRVTARRSDHALYNKGYSDSLNRVSLDTKLARNSVSYRNGWITAFTPVTNFVETHHVITGKRAYRLFRNKSVKTLKAGLKLSKDRTVYLNPTRNGKLTWSTARTAFKPTSNNLDPSNYYIGYATINHSYLHNKAYNQGMNDFFTHARLNAKLARNNKAYQAGWIIGFGINSDNGRASGIHFVNPEMHPLSHWSAVIKNFKQGLLFSKKHSSQKYVYDFDHWSVNSSNHKSVNIPKLTNTNTLSPKFYAKNALKINKAYAHNKAYRSGFDSNSYHGLNTAKRNNLAYRAGWIVSYITGARYPKEVKNSEPANIWTGAIKNYKAGTKRSHNDILYYYPTSKVKHHTLRNVKWHWSENMAKGVWGSQYHAMHHAVKPQSYSKSAYRHLLNHYLHDYITINAHEHKSSAYKLGHHDAVNYTLNAKKASKSKLYRDGWILSGDRKEFRIPKSIKSYLRGVTYAKAHHAKRIYDILSADGIHMEWHTHMLQGRSFLYRLMHPFNK